MGKLIAVQGCLIQSKTAGVTVANFQITTPPVNTVLADNKPVYAGTLSVIATGVTMGGFTCPTATFTILPSTAFATANNQFFVVQGDSGLCTCTGTNPQGATSAITFTAEIVQAGQTGVELDVSEGGGDLSLVYEQIQLLNTTITKLKSDLDLTNSELAKSKAEIEKNKTDITSAQSEIATQKEGLRAVNTELTTTKNSIPTKADIQSYVNSMDIINSNLNGDIITSNKGGSDISGHFIVIPKVIYHLIDPTHTTSTYMKELLKWICKNYPNTKGALMVTLANPNAQGFALIQIYDTSQVNEEGLPEYSTITYSFIGGGLQMFGTYNYSFYEKSVPTSTNSVENFSEDINTQENLYPMNEQIQ